MRTAYDRSSVICVPRETAANLVNRSTWIRGSAWLIGGNGIGLLLTMIGGVMLARMLGPSDFGLYSVVVVAVSLGVTIATFRLDMHLVTELRSAPSDKASVRRAVLASALIALPLCVLLAAAGFSLDVASPLVVIFAAVEVGLSPLLFGRVVLQVQARQSTIALAAVSNRVIWIAMLTAIVFWAPPAPLPAIFGARLVAYVVEIAVVLSASGTKLLELLPRRRRWPKAEIAALRASTPLALAGVAGTAYNRSDQLLLASLATRAETGIYAAGVRIADLLLFLGPIVQNVTVPGMVQLHRREDARGISRAVSDTVLMTVMPAGLALAVLLATRGVIVSAIFGAEYSAAESIVVVLALGAWVALIGTAVGSAALATGERSVLLLATVIGLVVNLVLNVFLLSRYGAIAAAWTSVIAYGVATLAPAIRPQLRPVVGAALWAASASFVGVLVAGAASVFVHGPVMAACVATGAYGLCLWFLRRSDVRRLTTFVATRGSRRCTKTEPA